MDRDTALFLSRRLTTPSLLIAGGGLALIAALTVIVRRRRDLAARRALAQRLDWEFVEGPQSTWMERLRDIALLRIGHSRRVGPVFRTKSGTYLFSYACETGFEHRHATHSWRVAVREVAPSGIRAAVTCQDWLIATTAAPVAHQVCVTPKNDGRQAASLIAVVEDVEQWDSILSDDFRSWLDEQPTNRNWEVQPGLVVVYEPGLFGEDAFKSLAESAETFSSKLHASTASG